MKMENGAYRHNVGAATQRLENLILQDKDEHSGFYQQSVFLRLTKPAAADYLQLDRSQTDLSIEFKPLNYNALYPANPALKAKTSVRDNKVIIAFPAPVHLVAIELLKNKGASAAYHLLIYRVDGEVIAEQASARARSQSNRAIPSSKKRGYRSQTHRYSCTIKGKVFALALNNISNNPVPFNAQWLAGLLISSHANSPSLSLLAPEVDKASQQLTFDNSTPSLIHLQAGELGSDDGKTANLGVISLQKAFSQTLQSALQRLQPALKQQVTPYVDFKIIMRSGAPCVVSLSDLSVVYANSKQLLLDDQSEKVSLKFNGDLQQPQTLRLSIPEMHRIDQAVLVIDQSFTRTADAIGASRLPPERLMLLTQAIQADQGMTANADERLCQSFTLATVYKLRTIWLAVSSLSTQTHFSLSIVNDVNGRPEGETVIRFPDSALDTQFAQWIMFSTSETTLLNSGDYWIVIDVHQGQLIWHLNEQSNQFIQHTNPQGIHHSFQSLQGRYVLDKENKLSEVADVNGDTQREQSVLINIDNIPLLAMDRDKTLPNSLFHYDMRPALINKTEQVSLCFFSSQRGMMTIYAPLITYHHGNNATFSVRAYSAATTTKGREFP